MEKSLLLIFNPQNDFIENYEDIVKNIILFIENNIENIHDLVLTQSSYQKFNIKFPSFWKRDLKAGDIITLGEILNRTKTPIAGPDEIDYEFLIEYIAKNGPITLCKEHCIEGTAGWAFPTRLIKSVNNWSINKKRLYSIQKVNDIPLIDTKSIISNESVLNERPFWRVVDYEKIYIAGFFKDTVIAKSIKDLISTGMYDDKLVFLESCIGTIDDKAESLKIIEDAIEHHGARVIKK